MNAVRWILGLMTGGVLFGTIVLVAVAASFRRSCGASPTHPLVAALPFVALALLLSGILFPGQRWLLHLGAVTAVAIIISCVTQMSDISLVGIAYSVFWLGYYWLAAWRGPSLP